MPQVVKAQRVRFAIKRNGLMKGIRSVVVAVLAPFVIAGCAVNGEVSGLNRCGVTGGLIGGAGSAAIASNVIAGLPGVVVGAALGQMLCWDSGDAQDSDEDGVANSQDACPGTMAGMTVNTMGCSLDQDADGDGVMNDSDRCPSTPIGTKVDDEGCTAIDGLLSVLKNVYFGSGQATIRPDAANVLQRVAKALAGNNTVRLYVEGHTDGLGSKARNVALSEQRARAVRDYLVANGVSADRIAGIRGNGATKPIASNRTEDGRVKNRRVELIVIGR